MDTTKSNHEYTTAIAQYFEQKGLPVEIQQPVLDGAEILVTGSTEAISEVVAEILDPDSDAFPQHSKYTAEHTDGIFQLVNTLNTGKANNTYLLPCADDQNGDTSFDNSLPAERIKMRSKDHPAISLCLIIENENTEYRPTQ